MNNQPRKNKLAGQQVDWPQEDRAHPQCLPALNLKSNLSILQPHTAAGQQDQTENQHHGLSNMQIHHSNSPAIAASSEVSWGELKHAELQHQFDSIQINRASEPGPQHPGHSTSAPSSNSRAELQGQLMQGFQRQHHQHQYKDPVATNSKWTKYISTVMASSGKKNQ
ncbi:hypothetical protein Nepgr_027275 [Nepenthes gracilis]|uniref:Uncharacterized protein n=1 Tax=Nepenthes gracilis TaxID=150966 RepID=A0AAD3T9R3_NEPGR|nr:hypothetical protein Nepgr_027275 [Nepenthes gracilis]